MASLDDLVQPPPSTTAVPSPGTGLERFGEPAQTSLETLQALLAALEAFRAPGAAYGPAELARRAGLPRSTAERVLAVLTATGLVRASAEGYRLGRRLHALATAA